MTQKQFTLTSDGQIYILTITNNEKEPETIVLTPDEAKEFEMYMQSALNAVNTSKAIARLEKQIAEVEAVTKSLVAA